MQKTFAFLTPEHQKTSEKPTKKAWHKFCSSRITINF